MPEGVEHKGSDHKAVNHPRFCPYCGRELGARSKFCPQCGKASPGRRDTTALGVEPSARPQSDSARTSANRSAQPVAETPARSSISRTGPRTVATRVASGRLAPPTHSLVGRLEQAGFGLRYGAWMFDFLITLIAMMTFTFIITALSHKSVVGSNRDLLIVLLMTLLLFILNFVVFAGFNGQSAGMRILGIRIVRTDGSPFTRKDAMVRHLIGYPLSLIGFSLGFLWILWDKRQQGWHDKLAHTLVVVSR